MLWHCELQVFLDFQTVLQPQRLKLCLPYNEDFSAHSRCNISFEGNCAIFTISSVQVLNWFRAYHEFNFLCVVLILYKPVLKSTSTTTINIWNRNFDGSFYFHKRELPLCLYCHYKSLDLEILFYHFSFWCDVESSLVNYWGWRWLFYFIVISVEIYSIELNSMILTCNCISIFTSSVSRWIS